ncbi:DALR anticodon-binding domain-containing protein [Shewanella sp. VB17]|uniref:DALR anticodon-binding domain-containing protein n=1 Tax=Shewanella sp. VB17 TaxID=2739432 RepID=UPI0035C9056B
MRLIIANTIPKLYRLGENAADLRESVDTFFEEVMVMSDDETLKNNRLALLSNLREQFLHAADISLLK